MVKVRRPILIALVAAVAITFSLALPTVATLVASGDNAGKQERRARAAAEPDDTPELTEARKLMREPVRAYIEDTRRMETVFLIGCAKDDADGAFVYRGLYFSTRNADRKKFGEMTTIVRLSPFPGPDAAQSEGRVWFVALGVNEAELIRWTILHGGTN